MSFKHHSDSELLALLVQGHDEVFTEIFDRYWKPMLSVAANKTGDLDEAEEIVQDIFVSLWKRRNVLEITSGLQNYLAMSVKYQVLKVLSARNKRLTLEEQNMTGREPAVFSGHDALEFEQLQAQLAELVSSLPQKCRLVYQLSREAGYSHKQIAAEMAISEKTVEAHIRKALKAIRQGLNFVLLSLTITDLTKIS